MFAQEFIRNALLAGSLIAVASGVIGYFVVLRGQVFAGDALSHVAFTGALAAAAAGLAPRVGLFAATVALALGLAALGSRARPEDATIGVLFSWVLGIGVLFLYLYDSGEAGTNGTIAARTLFGSIFGLSASQARLAAVIALGLVLAMAVIARPLLFATLDPLVARVRGIPVRALGVVFLVLLAIEAAEASETVGALLLLGLLAAPAGAAHRLTASPPLALGLSVAIALGSVWAGIALSYGIPSLPPGSAIVGVAVACYLAALVLGRRGERPDRLGGGRRGDREDRRRAGPRRGGGRRIPSRP
jgi:zinc/manganese transport system permease protein